MCRARCYAKRGFFHMPNVKQSHIRNYQFSQTNEFEHWMMAELTASFVRVMRVHAAGDFYDVDYVRKWVRIASKHQWRTFFAYTRSWRSEEMLPELVKLGALPNFQLWWSIDRETGPAPLIRGIRRAYMAIDDVDAEHAPDDCDLVFRDQKGTVMKKANGIMVCPPENGVETKIRLTCSLCKICWHQKTTRWEMDLLPYLVKDGDREINVPKVAHDPRKQLVVTT